MNVQNQSQNSYNPLETMSNMASTLPSVGSNISHQQTVSKKNLSVRVYANYLKLYHQSLYNAQPDFMNPGRTQTLQGEQHQGYLQPNFVQQGGPYAPQASHYPVQHYLQSPPPPGPPSQAYIGPYTATFVGPIGSGRGDKHFQTPAISLLKLVCRHDCKRTPATVTAAAIRNPRSSSETEAIRVLLVGWKSSGGCTHRRRSRPFLSRRKGGNRERFLDEVQFRFCELPDEGSDNFCSPTV